MNIGKEIKEKLKRNDMSAFSDIYDVYGNKIYHYILGLLRSERDAKDVLQNIFLRLLNKRNLLCWVRNLEGYIFRIARNESFRFMKKHRKNKEVLLENIPEILFCEKPDAKNEITEEEKNFLSQAVSRLSLHQREVIILKSFEDKSFREIAEILGISQNTAASRYRYAMGKLRDDLEGLER